MKNYQSPLENILICLSVFPLYSMHRLYSFMCYFTDGTVATDVLSWLSTQAYDNVIHIHIICSAFRESLFLPLATGPPWGDSRLPPALGFVDTFPHLEKHIISFNQFNQFVINESDKKLPDRKRPSYASWAFRASCSFFFLMSAVFLPITWSGTPSSSSCYRCIQSSDVILLSSVSNNRTSIPSGPFWLNNFLNFLCTALFWDMHFTVLNLIIPFILIF